MPPETTPAPGSGTGPDGRGSSPFTAPVRSYEPKLPTGAAAARGDLPERMGDIEFQRLPFEQRDQFARVRQDGFDGWQRRDTLGRQGAEQLPIEDKTKTADGREGVKVGDRVFTSEELATLAARAAADDVRKASLPTSPAEYRLELPSDFKLPNGVSIMFVESDPILGPIIQQARAWAHDQGFSQEQWSRMLSFQAATQAHQADLINQARQREVEALGPAASARVDAVSRFLRAELGDELAAPLLTTMATERHVRAYETLINKRAGTSLSQSHREPPSNERISDAAYEAMSPRERIAYQREASAAAAAAPAAPRGRQ